MSSVFSSAISGMNAAIARLSNAATNIANVSSTGKLPATPDGKATSFEPKDIVNITTTTGEVTTTSVPRTPAYHPMYSPNSPDANADGLVAAPNIALESEIVDSLMAKTAYQANAKIIAVEKEKQETLLDTLA